ncbi:uncharacterized protein Dana_GF18670, isoform B [Drosophila ananassae]|uniref:Uncharacterized protein, isoform B n=1 Tax=Drosophila ananassae TaxID=7217 RepID=A0A0P8XZX6_DROAN|nr:uncharacterized protein LOC6501441 isoform X2 [Drosophila ananassae]KPU80489.1 uncharacterized protein Dana_GF18670, isoform B [Drosophila ananassae]
MGTTKRKENLEVKTPKSNTFKKSLRNGQYKSQKVSRITTNGYLNYLREFKKQFSGLSPQDMVHFGAMAWNKLAGEEKISFRNMYNKDEEKKLSKVLRITDKDSKAKKKIVKSSTACIFTKTKMDRIPSVVSIQSSPLLVQNKKKRPKTILITIPDKCGARDTCSFCPENIGPAHYRLECPRTKKHDLFPEDISEIQSDTFSVENAWFERESRLRRPKDECCKIEIKSGPFFKSKGKVCHSKNTHVNNLKSDKSTLGSANAYINFTKAFVKKNGNISSIQLMRSAAYHWCKLTPSERVKFENRTFMQYKPGNY